MNHMASSRVLDSGNWWREERGVYFGASPHWEDGCGV
jgi:hypothetical protein